MKNIGNLKYANLSSVKPNKLKTQGTQRGSVVLEALIAIVLFSIGILAIAGLQAAMIKNASDNKYRSDASFIAQKRIGEMWADPNNVANYFETGTIIADALPNGTRTVVAEPTGRGLVTVIVTWQAPSGDTHQYTASTYIGAL